jgi:integrase
MMLASRKMPTDEQFDEFSNWMLERGRTADTASLYEQNLRHCFDDERGVLARVAQADLAPKTRRTNKAALAAWARFSRDHDLAERLAEVKLPPAERVSEKKALELEQWQGLLEALDSDEYMVRAEHAAISLICRRGFRISDVNRIDAPALRRALRSGILQFVTKGGGRLSWTVTDAMRPHLEYFASSRGWSRVCELVAPNWAEPMKGARLRCQRAFGRLLPGAGLEGEEVSLHLMRRTYAWHFLRFAGNDPIKLQKHMGWKSLDVAMQYVDQQQRAELDEIATELESALDS